MASFMVHATDRNGTPQFSVLEEAKPLTGFIFHAANTTPGGQARQDMHIHALSKDHLLWMVLAILPWLAEEQLFALYETAEAEGLRRAWEKDKGGTK